MHMCQSGIIDSSAADQEDRRDDRDTSRHLTAGLSAASEHSCLWQLSTETNGREGPALETRRASSLQTSKYHMTLYDFHRKCWVRQCMAYDDSSPLIPKEIKVTAVP